MNLLFLKSAAPSVARSITAEKRPPLGLGSLMSLARAKGHQVFFVDNYLRPSRCLEDGFLQKNRIDCVGIYADTICYGNTLRMLQQIEGLRESRRWQGKILVGGPHTSVACETIPDYVDHVVQGEGEAVLFDILDGKTSERVVRGERMTNLDDLPFQPWDIFTSLPYDLTCDWLDGGNVFTMNTSRGCPFQCAFCSVNSIWGSRYTYQSAERILAEIEYLVRTYEATGVYFREDHFTMHPRRTEEFCRKLISKNWGITWACETRVDSLSEDMVELMSRSGCRAVYLGVESGSPRMLELLNKQITVDQIEKAILLCKKHGVRTYCSLITGLPGETYEDYRMTDRLMKRLKPYSHCTSVFVGIPRSSLYIRVLQQNQYEYRDELGLLYLPGYDVRCRFFYSQSSRKYVNHRFVGRTPYDRKLQWVLLWQTFTGVRFFHWLKRFLYRAYSRPAGRRYFGWVRNVYRIACDRRS